MLFKSIKSVLLQYKNIYFFFCIVIFLLYLIFRSYNAGDFKIFYEIGLCFRNKENIYNSVPSGGKIYYLPHFALIMSIFSFFQFHVASILWSILKIISYIYIAFQLKKIVTTDLKLNESRVIFNLIIVFF